MSWTLSFLLVRPLQNRNEDRGLSPFRRREEGGSHLQSVWLVCETRYCLLWRRTCAKIRTTGRFRYRPSGFVTSHGNQFDGHAGSSHPIMGPSGLSPDLVESRTSWKFYETPIPGRFSRRRLRRRGKDNLSTYWMGDFAA
jgi:hypothetical protein